MSERSAELPSRRVEADLRRRIESGEWSAGQKLPPVSEFAASYRTSRTTIMKVLRQLENDGLLEIVANWGTFRK